jgi:hypothetical protein
MTALSPACCDSEGLGTKRPHSRNGQAYYGLIKELLIPDRDPSPTKGGVLLALAIVVSIVIALAH